MGKRMIPIVYLWIGLAALVAITVLVFVAYAIRPQWFGARRVKGLDGTPDGRDYWIAKPSFLRHIMPKNGLALGRCIHFGKGVDPSPWFIAHEWSHLGNVKLLRYAMDVRYRDAIETTADAYAWLHHRDAHFVAVASSLWTRRHYAPPTREQLAAWANMREANNG